MKAMVLAAGLGTRLQPLTFEVPKPMVPVLDRPVMAHILGPARASGVRRGDREPPLVPGHDPRATSATAIEYRHEEELLGTAGGVRNVRDFFGDDLVVVVSGDALTDLDLNAVVDRHRSAGGIATLTVKKVPDTREYGVVIHDDDGRIQGFQEKPDPAEALSDLGNCGIYCFSPEIFEYFPDAPVADWAQDVFPELLAHDVPFFVHEIDGYWNDVGSLDELRAGTFDALEGRLRLEVSGEEVAEGVRAGEGTSLDACEQVDAPVWVGAGCELGAGSRLMGPVVVGDRSRLGENVSLRESIVLPGTHVPAGTILVGAIVGHADIVEGMRPLGGG